MEWEKIFHSDCIFVGAKVSIILEMEERDQKYFLMSNG